MSWASSTTFKTISSEYRGIPDEIHKEDPLCLFGGKLFYLSGKSEVGEKKKNSANFLFGLGYEHSHT